jgi:cytochrome c
MKSVLSVLLLAFGAVAASHADEVISDARAQQLLAKYHCQACHGGANAAQQGPSFRQVAKKYASDPQAVDDLEASVLNGSSGTWGNNAMPSNDVPEHDLHSLVVWILQLM